MENFKKIIESKKLKSSDKKPRYGTRKLSVGLVSCMLGYFVFMSPTVVNAQTVEVESDTTTSVSESVDEPQKAEVNENSESASVSGDKEVAKKNTEVEERKEATTNVAVENEENALEKKTEVVANSEEITNKEGAPLVVEDKKDATGDKKAEEEDAEKAAKAVEEKEETVSAKENKDEKEVENKDVATENAGDLEVAAEEKEALGISEEIDPEAQTAEAASEETQNKTKDISNDIINPRVSIRTENTTKPGTLDAGLGEQLTWGVSFTTPEGTKKGDTFTVKLSDNMSLKGLEPDTDYALPVKFGDKIIATAKRIDRQTIQYTFTKDIEEMKYARVYIINSAQENKDVVQNSGDQTFKINVGEKAKAEKDINVDFGKLYHAETSENVNGRSQFTEFNPETGEFTQVFYLNPESKVINTSSTNDQNGREWGKVGFLLSSPHDADKPRSVDYLERNTTIEVKKLPKGAKLPDAIIENPEGAQLATKVEGEFRDFKGEPMFTMNFGGGNKIDSPYVVVVKGHANKIDGKYTELYSNGTLYGDGDASLFLDNLYTVQENSTDSEGEKETLGYFKEHHIYITKENGKEISRFKIPGATVSGTADEYYYTDKNEIPGYHFVKIGEGDNAPKNDPAYNDKGKITQGHFKVGETKEVTYIYENDITTKGSFTEHHVYKVYVDGVEDKSQESKIDIDKTTGKATETFTTSAKPNGTEDDKKEGFKLAENGITKSPEITEDVTGAEVTPNYVDKKDLEVTYVYRKDVKSWTPLEPATLIKGDDPNKDPKEDPKKPNEPTPLVPLTPAEHVEPKESTPPRRDHKTPGTPVVTEVPSTPIVETEKPVEEKTEKPVEEKTEETKEVENKEENLEEVKNVESEDKVVEKVETKEEDKNFALVSANDDTKAPKTGDAGILSSLGLGSLAASGLAFIELKKRNKKNK